MKKLMLILGMMAGLASCEKAEQDMSANDLPALLGSKDNEPYAPTSSKDSFNPRSQTAYYFAAYQTSKTAGSEKLGMDISKNVPDAPNQLYISGYSFVNMYGAAYEYNKADGSIKNKNLITTEMAGVDAANKAETEFYKNLQEAAGIIFEDKQIKILVGKPIKEIMIFRKR